MGDWMPMLEEREHVVVTLMTKRVPRPGYLVTLSDATTSTHEAVVDGLQVEGGGEVDVRRKEGWKGNGGSDRGCT